MIQVKNKSLFYMLFVLGLVLILMAVYLGTYKTTEVVYGSVSVPVLGSVSVPSSVEVYPFQGLAVVLGICAFGLIGFSLVKIVEK
jgi:hypothetical protein